MLAAATIAWLVAAGGLLYGREQSYEVLLGINAPLPGTAATVGDLRSLVDVVLDTPAS